MKKIIMITAAALCLCCCGNRNNGGAQDEAAGAEVAEAVVDLDAEHAKECLRYGSAAPEFTIPRLDGGELSLADLKGMYVVLDFWASWCKDCRADLPKMKEAFERFGSTGVEFVGISLDDDRAAWEAAVKEFDLKYIQVSEGKKWADSTVAPLFGIKWIPTMYLISQDGNVLLATVQIDKLIDKLAEVTGL
ncbi:MAG: TlpA family protein disulfide reductase [Bacteroidales bacterium]|nr:TlpA family protein disulfide reductase [Bacteroidales bacterium]